jgi:S-formylglutathione hydrolase FrmB
MRRALVILAALGAALVVAIPAQADLGRCSFDEQPASPRIVPGKLDGLPFNVLLPSDYGATSRRYPVLYLLHGGDYNENTWLVQTRLQEFTAPFTGGRAAIVVLPDGGPMGFYADWKDGTQQWESYHLRRLVPYVDAHFRTRANREFRAVAGFSLGGFGAMHYAARHPDLFVAAASFSGLVHLTTPEDPYRGAASEPRPGAGEPGAAYGGRPAPRYEPPTDAGSGCQSNGSAFGDRTGDAVVWHDHNPTDLASNLRGLSLYVGAGDGVPCDDEAGMSPSLLFGAEPGALEMSRALDGALTAAGVAHTTAFAPCGLHSMVSAEHHLEAFWPQMMRAFQGKPPPVRFDHRTADPDFAVWGWTFHADRQRAMEFLEARGITRHGLTLTGSGTETIVTPRLFRRRQLVQVTGARPGPLARADRRGRLTLTVDLGPPHARAQFGAGDAPPEFVTRRVVLAPRGRR